MRSTTKELSTLCFVLFVALFVALACSGCRTPDSAAAFAKLQQTRADAEADGAISPDEAKAIQEAVVAYVKAEKEGLNWSALGGTALTAALSAFLGTNAYRNNREKRVWGEPA